MAAGAGWPAALGELGSGTGRKTRWLLESLPGSTYYPIDLSSTALESCRTHFEHLACVAPMCTTYLAGLAQAASKCNGNGRLLVLFLGSTIGNFDRTEALDFLIEGRQRLRPGEPLFT